MQILISRQREDGSFSTCGGTDRTVMLHIPSESCAIRQAIAYAGGRGFRLELYSDAQPYGEPFKVIVQTAFSFTKF